MNISRYIHQVSGWALIRFIGSIRVREIRVRDFRVKANQARLS